MYNYLWNPIKNDEVIQILRIWYFSTVTCKVRGVRTWYTYKFAYSTHVTLLIRRLISKTA